MSGPTYVYLLNLTGVSARLLGGIFTTREAAEAHARALWDDSDHYHDPEITQVQVDEPVWPESRRWVPPTDRPRPFHIEYISWDDV